MNQRTNECEWVSGWVVESVIITKRTERKFRPKPSLSPPPLLYTVCLCLYYIRGVRSPSLPRLWEMIIVWDELLVFSFKSKELFPVSKEVRSPVWVGSVKLPGPGIYWLTCCLYHVTLLGLSEHSDYSQPGLLMVWRFEGEGAWHPHVSMYDNITTHPRHYPVGVTVNMVVADALYPGSRLNIKTVFPRYGIPMLKIRRSRDRLIFNMGIPILVRRHLYIEMAPLVSRFLKPLPKPVTQIPGIKFIWNPNQRKNIL